MTIETQQVQAKLLTHFGTYWILGQVSSDVFDVVPTQTLSVFGKTVYEHRRMIRLNEIAGDYLIERYPDPVEVTYLTRPTVRTHPHIYERGE